ncbi:hypothetical protein STEG23_000395, partial [Scotinomys teguina]
QQPCIIIVATSSHFQSSKFKRRSTQRSEVTAGEGKRDTRGTRQRLESGRQQPRVPGRKQKLKICPKSESKIQ